MKCLSGSWRESNPQPPTRIRARPTAPGRSLKIPYSFLGPRNYTQQCIHNSEKDKQFSESLKNRLCKFIFRTNGGLITNIFSDFTLHLGTEFQYKTAISAFYVPIAQAFATTLFHSVSTFQSIIFNTYKKTRCFNFYSSWLLAIGILNFDFVSSFQRDLADFVFVTLCKDNNNCLKIISGDAGFKVGFMRKRDKWSDEHTDYLKQSL